MNLSSEAKVELVSDLLGLSTGTVVQLSTIPQAVLNQFASAYPKLLYDEAEALAVACDLVRFIRHENRRRHIVAEWNAGNLTDGRWNTSVKPKLLELLTNVEGGVAASKLSKTLGWSQFALTRRMQQDPAFQRVGRGRSTKWMVSGEGVSTGEEH